MERATTADKEQTHEPFGLYVHVPFCERKCPYCDFNTYANLDHLFQRYVDALCGELRLWGERLKRRTVDTIFLGGGTPTVLAAAQLSQIVETIDEAFRLAPDCEFTSEANPGTVDRAKFSVLRALGVNRLSMGVQSFQPEELSFLGRIHSVDDVDRAFAAARKAGFDNVNLDFIFGLPHQPIANWRSTLDRAVALDPEHLSLYSLIVEPNTPLYHWVQIGRVDAPDDDHAAHLYEIAMERMAQAGYVQYEVSNWVKFDRQGTGDRGQGSSRLPAAQTREPCNPPLACRHNLIYWRNQEYVGIGPGAHSHLGTDVAARAGLSVTADTVAVRWSNRRPVPGYIQRVNDGESAVEMQESIDAATAMGETMMLGLRLLGEGISFRRFRDRYGADLRNVYAEELNRFTHMDLLHMDDARVRLTRRGLMVGNQIFAAFLP